MRSIVRQRCVAEPGPMTITWPPDQQRTTPQARRAAQHPGNVPETYGALFRLDAGRLDDRPPAGGLGLLILAERFRRLLVEWGYLNAEIVKMLARFWIGQHPDHGGVQFRNNVLRHALGRP